MELCKTGIEKSSIKMLNYYVVSAVHDMVNDTGRCTTCRSKPEVHHYKEKKTENEGLSENMGFT